MADSYFSSLRSGARDVRDDAEDYGRRAAGRLRDTGERLRDKGDDARGELSRLWADLEDLVEKRLGPAASEAGRSASRYAYQGRDMAVDYAQQLRDVTRSRPLVAIGVAVAATWLITSMLRSGRR
jgi:predicted phage gp36 major capsid-like protein